MTSHTEKMIPITETIEHSQNEGPGEIEKPLSPVLNNSKANRRFLIGRRLHKKARVCLTNSFDKLANKPTTSSEPSSFVEPFTLSQTDKLMQCESEFEKQNPAPCSLNNSRTLDDKSCFKIPLSPAPHAKKHVETEHAPNTHDGSKSHIISSKPQSSTFKTAAGKAIFIPDSAIQQHSKLFEDILKSQKSTEIIRKNKYSFLTKSKKIETFKCSVNIDSLSKEKSGNDEHNESFASFTQLISDSGISNTQIVSACDNLMNDKISEHIISKEQPIPNSAIKKLDASDFLVREQELYEKTKLALEVANNYCKYRHSNNANLKSDFTGFTPKEISASLEISVKVSDMLDNILESIENSISCANLQKPIPERTIFSLTDQNINHTKLQSPNNMANKNNQSFGHNGVSCGKVNRTDVLKSPPNKKTKRDYHQSKYSGKDLPLSNTLDLTYKTTKLSSQVHAKEVDHKVDAMEVDTNINETKNLGLNLNPFLEIKFAGFKTASGNKINISEKMLQHATRIFDIHDTLELPEVKSNTLLQEANFSGFKTASGNKITVTEETLKNAKKVFESCDIEAAECNDKLKPAFKLSNFDLVSDASERTVLSPIVSEVKHSPRNSVCRPDSNSKKPLNNLMQKPSNLNQLEAIPTCTPNSFIPVNKDNSLHTAEGPVSFKTALGADIKISQNSLLKARRLFGSESMPTLQEDFPADCVESIASKNMLLQKEGSIHNLSADESDGNNNSDIRNVENQQGETSKCSKTKRRLGVSTCKPIALSETQLQRAKQLFKDDFPVSLVSASSARPTHGFSKFEGISSHSTPIKHSAQQNQNSFVDNALTPIKVVSTPIKDIESNLDCQIYTDAPLLIQKPTDGNIDTWIKDLEHEKYLLQKKLEILTHRSQSLMKQKCSLENNSPDQCRRRLGVLSQKKNEKPRLTWLELVKNKRPRDSSSQLRLPRITEVTPQNAEYIHFNCFLGDNDDTVRTDDGACVVPNSKNLIGFSEIESAFRAMPGVEPKLIPKGWMRNHFKWITWKLASYERSFPEECNGCFSVENILLQLKYRYDREIDKAERPALRKIYERDDSSLKRMVLCVCDIIKVNNTKFELVLTDGWYSIRTVIDEPLCEQVVQGKIQIGTKLIISGAELLNCDGCYPLETTDLVRLKIAFNSTRRARWYCKLGYQQIPTAFPIPIETVNPLGGNIGCIKIHIARMYPIRFMERQDNVTVWRNRKAEERRAQEWENEQMRKIEDLRDSVCREYDSEHPPILSNTEQQKICNIKDVRCPRTLYHILKNSPDPAQMQEELTESQRRAVLKYQQNLSMSKQQELSSKITESLSKIKKLKRDVSSILKMVVIDIYKPSTEGVTFHIWNPTESHLEMLKEGKSFYIYNVTPKRNGDLSTNARTKFEHLTDAKMNLDSYARHFTPIGHLQQPGRKLFLNEFDTIGIVVQTNIHSCSQELWLSDHEGRLLHVKISEGPINCLLLDNLRRGQIVCCSNLTSCQRTDKFCQALANHFTVFSNYPQQKHLQDGLEIFQSEIKDINEILNSCDIKIEEYTKMHTKSTKMLHLPDVSDKSTTTLDDSAEESTLVYSRITSTDIAMSLIDIDQFK